MKSKTSNSKAYKGKSSENETDCSWNNRAITTSQSSVAKRERNKTKRGKSNTERFDKLG